jgi:hypothetical protein
LATKRGFTFRAAGGQYDESGLTMKFKVEDPGAKTEATAENFKIDAPLIGLNADDFGKTFRVGRATYTITSINIAAPRYPVVARRADGKSFKFGVDTVLIGLGRPRKPLFGSSPVLPPPGLGKTFQTERGDV